MFPKHLLTENFKYNTFLSITELYTYENQFIQTELYLFHFFAIGTGFGCEIWLGEVYNYTGAYFTLKMCLRFPKVV